MGEYVYKSHSAKIALKGDILVSTPNRHQNLNFEESVEDYKQRLITYEMELNEMNVEGTISKGQFKRRIKHLKFLRRVLNEICLEWASGKQSISGDLHYPLPNLNQCEPQEQIICRKQVMQRYKVLRGLVKNTNKIVKVITKTLSGKSNIFSLTVSLSSLRTKLTKIDAQLHVLKRGQKRIDDYTQALMKEEKKIIPLQNASITHISLYKNYFYKIQEKNTQIRDLKIKSFQENQRTNWMERWLKFQQEKISTYYVSYSIPSSETIQVLDKNVSEMIQSKSSHDHRTLRQKDQSSLATLKAKLRNSFRQKVRGEVN